MEIKVGDKVRVREDAPRIYTQNCLNLSIHNMDFEVSNIEDGCANIKNEDGILTIAYVVPLKYLVKVDAEAKEAKFKVGDRVRVMGYGYEPNLHKGDIGEILDTNDKGQCFVLFKKSQAWIYADCLELYTEPTEQTEAEKTKTKGDILTFPIAFDLNEALKDCDCFVSIREQMRKAQRDMEEKNRPRYVPKIMFNTEFWVKYEADLAKEVALKVANKFNTPHEAAEYAVSVAKAVVEGLKRK